MVVAPLDCPACQGTEVVHDGNTSDGQPRVRCQHATGTRVTCIRVEVDQGRLPSVTRQMLESSRHARGIRALARG